MKPHTHFGQLAVLVWLNEDICTCTFHGAGEVDLEFRVVSRFECRNAKHWYSVITWRYGRSDCFTDSSVCSYWNHREALRNRTAKNDLGVRIISREIRL